MANRVVLVAAAIAALSACGDNRGSSTADAGVASDAHARVDGGRIDDASVGIDASTDHTPPSIVSSTPADGDYPVSVLVNPTVTFDEDLDPASVSAASVELIAGPSGVRGGRVAGDVTYDAGSRTLTFTSPSALEHDLTYSLVLHGIADRWGNQMPATAIHFETFHDLPALEVAYTTSGDVMLWIAWTFDATGRVLHSALYGAAGPDGVWFTADDTISNYVIEQYDSTGTDVREISESGAGPDGMWNTDDDVVTGYSLLHRDASGNQDGWIGYGGPGPDGVWFTSDDRVSNYSVWTLPDALGVDTESIYYVQPGPDGIWFTMDDVPQSYTKTSRTLRAAR